MKNIEFKYIEPLEMHDCEHCKHLRYDLSLKYICEKLGVVPHGKQMYQNDCRLWASLFVRDITPAAKPQPTPEPITQLSIFSSHEIEELPEENN